MKKNIALILLSIALLFSMAHHIKDEKDASSCLYKYKYLNLDLDCDEDPSSKTDALEESVQEVIDTNISLKNAESISVFYRDLANRQWFGINENEVFAPASLLKLPLAIAFYKVAEIDKSTLNKTLMYEPVQGDDLYFIQNIKPERKLEEGKLYTIEELIKYMIQHSDNGALNILSNSINQDFFNQVSLDLGIKFPIGGDLSEDFVSVKTYGAIMRTLYNSSYLSQELSNKLLEVLVGTTFTEGIMAGVPKDVDVANKFGERRVLDITNNVMKLSEFHDCGIIYDKRGSYVLCVMTKGKNIDELTKVISEISKTIYENR